MQSKSEGDFPRGLRPHNAWTPTDAQPSVGGDGSGAIGLPPQSFPTQFVKNIIEDALDDFREQIRRDILDVHTSMLKQFLLQQVGGTTCVALYFDEILTCLHNFTVRDNVLWFIQGD